MKLHDSTDKMFTRPDQTDPLRVTDTTGKVWMIWKDCPPVPSRACDWSATDEDYDGAPDSATRHRVAHGATREACIADIERIVAEEQGTEEHAEQARKLGEAVLDILHIEREMARGASVKHWLGFELEVRAAARALGLNAERGS